MTRCVLKRKWRGLIIVVPTLTLVCGAMLVTSLTAASRDIASGGSSLRYYGHGVSDIDRVKIKLDAPARPVDVGVSEFTFEWWMKANAGENPSTDVLCNQNDGWIHGNIIFDRDIWNSGDYGDYGISLTNGRVAFGVNNGSSGTTVCGSTSVTDGQWHHVAVTRSYPGGNLRIFVDGVLDGERDGPNGDVSYRDGRSTTRPDDPYLVIGAEKHDAGSNFPSYSGWVDELRISNVIRYSSNFTPPTQPFASDANSVGLYHFDEGSGNTINDSSGAAGGPSNGTREFGGSSPAGPVWSSDTPFGGSPPPPTVTPTPTHMLPPVIIGTPESMSLAHFAVIGWQTDILGDSRVRYRSDTICDEPWSNTITNTTQVIFHTVVLSNLSVESDYCYQAQSGNAAGDTAWTSGQTFTTLAEADVQHSYLPLVLKQWSAP